MKKSKKRPASSPQPVEDKKKKWEGSQEDEPEIPKGIPDQDFKKLLGCG